MKNRTIVMAIGLGFVLTLIAPAVVPHFVFAQTCKDARGNTIECPAADQGGHKKKPSPTRPRDYKTDTPTPTPPSTPTMISGVTLTPTKVPVVPIIPGGDGPGPQVPDSGSGWPLSFGSETTKMLFDGDPFHKFPGGSPGFFGLVILVAFGFMGITFIRIRAARINYEKHGEDTGLIFDKQKAEGGPMPLTTEIGFPDGDSHAKNAPYLEDPTLPGSEVLAADAFAELITAGDDPAKPHVLPDGLQPTSYQADDAAPVEHKQYYEEPSAGRTGVPAPKKFPKPGYEIDQNTNTQISRNRSHNSDDGSDNNDRGSDDDD